MVDEDIKESFKKVITYSQGIRDPQVDDLFNQWEKNKKRFIDRMGGKLIWESDEEVSFPITDKEKRFMLDHFCTTIAEEYATKIGIFLGDVSYDDFFNNLTSKEYEINVSDTQTITVPKGIKVLRAFNFFEDDEDTIKDLQQQASAIIQKNKIVGKMCISVHPLDYLSVSENTSNWRSCHALDGEYRAGNLQYMADSATVICYLKSTKNSILPNFPESVPWNNKKWRCLLFFSNDFNLLFAGRQYPFAIDDAFNLVRDMIKQAGLGKWSNWNKDYLTSFGEARNIMERLIPIANGMKSIYNIIIAPFNPLFYNDLLNSSVYTHPYYCYNIDKYNFTTISGWTTMKDTRINIGEKVKCLSCNERNLLYSEIMTCPMCNPYLNTEYHEAQYIHCDQCGREIHKSMEALTAYEGENVRNLCEDCIKEITKPCLLCQGNFYKDYIDYDEQCHGFICEACNKIMSEDDIETKNLKTNSATYTITADLNHQSFPITPTVNGNIVTTTTADFNYRPVPITATFNI